MMVKGMEYSYFIAVIFKLKYLKTANFLMELF